MSNRQEDQDRESQQILHCRQCDTPIPLRLSRPGEEAASWVCASCETAFVGVFDECAVDDIHGNVRLRATYFAQGWADDVPIGMKPFLADLTTEKQPHSGQDRRRDSRLDQPAVVSVVPVNASYTPIGEAFPVMTRNFSWSGLGLIHTRSVDVELIALALSPDKTRQPQFIARVKWCCPLRQFYEIGCEFVARLVS